MPTLSLLLAEDGPHPRELSDPERRMIVMDVAEQWAVLNTAGITEDDVLAVTRDRVLMKVEQYRTAATRLEAAAGDSLTFAPPKASVPDGHRWGYGPTLSQRDIDGAQRVLAVAHLEALAAAAAPPVEAIFDGVVSSLARRHSRGDHDMVQFFIDQARHHQQARAGTPGTCRVCGCIDLVACKGGCTWVDAGHTLCSSCAATKEGEERMDAQPPRTDQTPTTEATS